LEFNKLAVDVEMVATTEFRINVDKKDFVPCPKVDPSLVRFQRRPKFFAIDSHWLDFTWTFFFP